MKFVTFAILSLLFCLNVSAQDPEFPKEFIIHLNFHSGMVTDFSGKVPDLYTGGIQLIPQYTFITHLMRGGVVADGFYTNRKLQGAFGPTISIKLLTLKSTFGSLGNIHLNFNHLWGTGSQRLIGGGINADLGNKIVFGLSLQRDYHLDNWWLQSNVAFRISKKTKGKQI